MAIQELGNIVVDRRVYMAARSTLYGSWFSSTKLSREDEGFLTSMSVMKGFFPHIVGES